MDKILVVGAGSWGTSFANYLALEGHGVKIWVREPEVLASILENRENRVFLPGAELSDNLVPVSDLEAEVKDADILLFAVPSKYLRSIFERLKGLTEDKPLVSLSKGFESSSLKTVSQLAQEVLGPRILENWITLSGPSFAKELSARFPTAVAAASANLSLVERIQNLFSSTILRIYRTDDLIGVEVAGSLKNVMAIASGIVTGSGFGFNTTAALVTRATMEISRFGVHLGAKKETFWGLAGIGDLMLTCFGSLSRNYQLGTRIAKGESLEEIERSSVTVAEGVETTKAVHKLSKQKNIEMPITSEVHQILFEGKEPQRAVKELMMRSLKQEWNIN